MAKPKQNKVLTTSKVDTKDTVIADAVVEAKSLITKQIANTVQLYWNLGKLVAELDQGYGKAAVKEFATQLSIAINREEAFNESTLYRARQFFTKFGAEISSKLITGAISWTQIVRVLPEDTNLVIAAISQIEAGTINPSQFADTVVAMRQGDGDPAESKALQANDPESSDSAILASTDLSSGSDINNSTNGGSSGSSGVQSSENGANRSANNDSGDGQAESSSESGTDRLGSEPVFSKELKKAESQIASVVDVMGTVFLLLEKFNNFEPATQRKHVKALIELRSTLSNLSKAAGPIFKALQEIK